MTWNFKSPALKIDADIASIHAGHPVTLEQAHATLHARQLLERRIVWNLIERLARAGFVTHGVHDGDTYTRTTSKGPQAAMELVFNLDEASLRFFTGDPRGDVHGVLLVLGNGVDIVSDWNYTDGDPDGFSAAMDGFNDLIYKFEGE